MSAKKNTKTSNNYECEAVGEWVADVQTKQDRHDGMIRRKVKTTGIERMNICKWDELIELLRKGREVRLTHDGEEVLRFYPLLDAQFKSMYVVSQTLGSLRHAVSDIKFEITSRIGKDKDTLELGREHRMLLKTRKQRLHVTPDTVVTCPNCGTEFRVGKQLY